MSEQEKSNGLPTEPGWYLCDVTMSEKTATIALKWDGYQFNYDDACAVPFELTKKGVA